MVSAPGLGLAAVPAFDRTQHGIPRVTLHLPAMHGTETGPGKGPQVLCRLHQPVEDGSGVHLEAPRGGADASYQTASHELTCSCRLLALIRVR
jgi:hypothetical protein